MMWYVLIGFVFIVGVIGIIGAGAIRFAPENNKDFSCLLLKL